MATIIPRAQPGAVQVQLGPQARNTTQVSAAPAEAIARGLDAIGRQGFAYAQQQQEQNDVAALMEARRRLSDWEASTFDPANENGISKYRGKQALDANEYLTPDLDKRISDIDATLTPGQRAKFGQVAGAFRAEFTGRLNTYMDREFTQYREGEEKAAVEQLGNDAILAGLNGEPEQQDVRLGELLGMREAQLTAQGVGEQAKAADLRGMQSTIRARTIEGVAGRDPLAAEQMLQKHLGELTPQDRMKVESMLQPVVNAAMDEAEADAIIGGGQVAAHRDPGQRGRPSPEISSILDQAADKHGVPRHYLYALAEQESSFNPGAVNPEVLDDGDNATGLFQYRATSAGGIDRKDARASADRAAAEFKRRMASGGADFAVAAHFAGEGGADAVLRRGRRAENPKTAEYIEQVRGRAGRWEAALSGRAPAQAGEQSGPVAAAPAASLADALARADAITDPMRRRRVKAVIQDRFQLRDLARRENEESTSRAIMETMYGDPTDLRPIRQRLTPDQYRWAQNNGKLEALEAIRTKNVQGLFVQDELPFKETLLREAAASPDAFAKRNLADPDVQARLSTDTLHRLNGLQESVRKGGAAAAQEWATESQLLGQAYTELKLSGSDNAKKRDEFEAAYLREKRAYNEANGGRNPGADEQQAIINRLKLPMVRERFWGLGPDAESRVYRAEEGARVPQSDRTAIIAGLREAGIAAPTEAQIVEAYQRGAGSDL